jgi:hypothetical protein
MMSVAVDWILASGAEASAYLLIMVNDVFESEK